MVKNDDLVVYSPEVARARAEMKPIVALESTIIAHGMPYPSNLETARALEGIVREHGAVPATIALEGGRILAGLSEVQLTDLARAEDVAKVSRRDLPLVLAKGGMGATTVAATLICAAHAGIDVFATGGIGGVHRGLAQSLDISADLTQMARTNIAVVCAGVKSVLDIGNTLEFMEMLGIPVVGYRTDVFPAFYTRESGFGVDVRVNEPEEIRDMLVWKWQKLKLTGGLLVVNPVPEEDAMDAEAMEAVINAALDEASQRGITGKAVTPFLLGRLVEMTGGESLKTNIALVKNNAGLAADIAVAMAQDNRNDPEAQPSAES